MTLLALSAPLSHAQTIRGDATGVTTWRSLANLEMDCGGLTPNTIKAISVATTKSRIRANRRSRYCTRSHRYRQGQSPVDRVAPLER